MIDRLQKIDNQASSKSTRSKLGSSTATPQKDERALTERTPNRRSNIQTETPLSKAERKRLKRSERSEAKALKAQAKSSGTMVTTVEVQRIADAIHPPAEASSTPETSSSDATDNLLDNDIIMNNLGYYSGTFDFYEWPGRKDGTGRKRKNLNPTLTKTQDSAEQAALMSAILERLGVPETVAGPNTKARKGLVCKILEAIKKDLIIVSNENNEIMMRMAGYWRYASKKTYNLMVQNNEIWDWQTGAKLQELDLSEDYDEEAAVPMEAHDGINDGGRARPLHGLDGADDEDEHPREDAIIDEGSITTLGRAKNGGSDEDMKTPETQPENTRITFLRQMYPLPPKNRGIAMSNEQVEQYLKYQADRAPDMIICWNGDFSFTQARERVSFEEPKRSRLMSLEFLGRIARNRIRGNDSCLKMPKDRFSWEIGSMRVYRACTALTKGASTVNDKLCKTDIILEAIDKRFSVYRVLYDANTGSRGGVMRQLPASDPEELPAAIKQWKASYGEHLCRFPNSYERTVQCFWPTMDERQGTYNEIRRRLNNEGDVFDAIGNPVNMRLPSMDADDLPGFFPVQDPSAFLYAKMYRELEAAAKAKQKAGKGYEGDFLAQTEAAKEQEAALKKHMELSNEPSGELNIVEGWVPEEELVVKWEKKNAPLRALSYDDWIRTRLKEESTRWLKEYERMPQSLIEAAKKEMYATEAREREEKRAKAAAERKQRKARNRAARRLAEEAESLMNAMDEKEKKQAKQTLTAEEENEKLKLTGILNAIRHEESAPEGSEDHESMPMMNSILSRIVAGMPPSKVQEALRSMEVPAGSSGFKG